MALCMNQNCTNELTGRQRTFCGDRCRKAQERADKAVMDALQSPKSDKSDTNIPPNSDKVGQSVRVMTKSDKPVIPEQQSYNRMKVGYVPPRT